MELSACVDSAAPPSLLQGVPSLHQARQDHYTPSVRSAAVAMSGDLLPPSDIELGERRDPISLEPITSPPSIRRTASIGTSSGRDFCLSLPQIPPPVTPRPDLIAPPEEADSDMGITIICPPRNGLLLSPTDESEKSGETGEAGASSSRRGASGRLGTSGAGPAVRKGSPSLSRARLGLGEIRLDLGALRARTERDFNAEAMEVRARKEKFAFFEKDCSRVLEHVFVGSDYVARSREILREAGVTHVLNCVGFVCPEYFPGDIVYKTLWLQVRERGGEEGRGKGGSGGKVRGSGTQVGGRQHGGGRNMRAVLYDVFDFIEGDNTAEDITCVLYGVFDYMEGVREGGHGCSSLHSSHSLHLSLPPSATSPLPPLQDNTAEDITCVLYDVLEATSPHPRTRLFLSPSASAPPLASPSLPPSLPPSTTRSSSPTGQHSRGHHVCADNTAEDITCVLYDVFDYMEGVREGGGRVFVHCCQGVSRSTSLVIAYLMWTQRLEFEEAFRRVKAVRGVASPNMGFACQLLQWQKRILPPKSAAPAAAATAAAAAAAPPAPVDPPTVSAAAAPAASEAAGGVVRQHMYRMAPHSPYDALHLVPKTVPFSRNSLDPRGCFLVQVGSAVFCWEGKQCHSLMAQQGLATARQIIKYESLGGEPVMVTDGQELESFLAALGDGGGGREGRVGGGSGAGADAELMKVVARQGLTYLGQDAKLLDGAQQSCGCEVSEGVVAAAAPESATSGSSSSAPDAAVAAHEIAPAAATPASAAAAPASATPAAAAAVPTAASSAAQSSPLATILSDSPLSPSALSSTSQSTTPSQPKPTTPCKPKTPTPSPPKPSTSPTPASPLLPSLPHAASAPNAPHTPTSPEPPNLSSQLTPPNQASTSAGPSQKSTSPGFSAYRTSSSLLGSTSLFGAVDRFAQKLRRRSWDRKEAEQLRKMAAAAEKEVSGKKEKGKEGKGRKSDSPSEGKEAAAGEAEGSGGGTGTSRNSEGRARRSESLSEEQLEALAGQLRCGGLLDPSDIRLRRPFLRGLGRTGGGADWGRRKLAQEEAGREEEEDGCGAGEAVEEGEGRVGGEGEEGSVEEEREREEGRVVGEEAGGGEEGRAERGRGRERRKRGEGRGMRGLSPMRLLAKLSGAAGGEKEQKGAGEGGGNANSSGNASSSASSAAVTCLRLTAVSSPVVPGRAGGATVPPIDALEGSSGDAAAVIDAAAAAATDATAEPPAAAPTSPDKAPEAVSGPAPSAPAAAPVPIQIPNRNLVLNSPAPAPTASSSSCFTALPCSQYDTDFDYFEKALTGGTPRPVAGFVSPSARPNVLPHKGRGWLSNEPAWNDNPPGSAAGSGIGSVGGNAFGSKEWPSWIPKNRFGALGLAGGPGLPSPSSFSPRSLAFFPPGGMGIYGQELMRSVPKAQQEGGGQGGGQGVGQNQEQGKENGGTESGAGASAAAALPSAAQGVGSGGRGSVESGGVGFTPRGAGRYGGFTPRGAGRYGGFSSQGELLTTPRGATSSVKPPWEVGADRFAGAGSGGGPGASSGSSSSSARLPKVPVKAASTAAVPNNRSTLSSVQESSAREDCSTTTPDISLLNGSQHTVTANGSENRSNNDNGIFNGADDYSAAGLPFGMTPRGRPPPTSFADLDKRGLGGWGNDGASKAPPLPMSNRR
ncbi:unnamed protein product [Closterium sp. NIES-65]|nr:unnamed protein product [Closterium sp. NIES-65]